MRDNGAHGFSEMVQMCEFQIPLLKAVPGKRRERVVTDITNTWGL